MAKLAPTQIEQLQSIGAYLRQVRQEQGLAIDMLANQIFIRPALLKALESGHDAELPEPVFIQGFIRRYAEALGLDGQTIAQEFRVTPVNVLPTPELMERADTNGTAAPAPEPPRPVPRMSDRIAAAAPEPASRSSLTLVLSLAALAALGLGAWGLFGRSNGPSQANNGNSVAETTPDPSPDAAAPAPAETTTPPEEPLATEDEPNVPLEAPVVVSANLSDRAWLSVVADGENVYEGVAESGFEETWTAQTSLTLRTGNAGGVELSINGDRAVVMGDSGVVRTVTVTPDSGVESVESP